MSSIALLFFGSTTLAATLDVGPSETYATIADALAAAADGDKIKVNATTVSEEITVDGLQVTIVGVGWPTWSAAPTTQIATIDVVNGAELTLGGFQLDGAPSFYPGIYLDNTSTLTVNRTRFEDFETTLYQEGGSATLDRVQITGILFSGEPQIEQWSGSLEIVDSTVTDSAASVEGVVVSHGDLTVSGSTFARLEGNIGGAITCYGGCTIETSTFTDNYADYGGAAVLSAGDLTMVRNRLCGNDAWQGALFVGGGTASVRNNAFLDNTGTFDGVGLIVDNADIELANNTFDTHTSALGLATSTVLLHDSTATLTNNIFLASLDGAGVLADNSTVTSNHNLWFGNQSDTSGFAAGPDALFADPLLAGGTGCGWGRVFPDAASPVVDAGDPAILDNDGSVSDIGASGGPGGR